ncbi:MAG: gliding motility-associated C-terminal domain-containing protein, partial [Bacteroidales bacterium]|nr:gliding motility-associated C-terminal domain-containing protein [Bacteroidales bacterium]
LTQGGVTDVVNWSTISGLYSATNTTTFTNNYFSNDKVYVELTDANGCTNTDSVNVLMNAIPVLNLTEDTAICKFDTIHLTLDNTTDSINWYSLSLGLLKTNSNTLDLYIENTDTIWVDAFTDQGCMNFDTIIINARELPIADAGEDQLICEGYSTEIGPDVPLTGATYLWSPNLNIDDINLANPTVTPVADTRYFVDVTDQYGCHADDSVLVQINPKGVFDIGQDTSVCPGESVELGGNPTATGSILEYSYEWTPTENLSGINSANPIAYPTETTIYRLVIFTGDCPVDTLYTTVTVNPLPEITIMNDTLAGFQEDITLWASGGVEYQWMPEEFLDNAYIQEPTANLEQTTHFTVEVTNEFGCTDTSGVNIFVKNEVFIPELFTPNNDGNNDYFKVYGFGIKELSLIIFNDLGIVVFKSNNLDEILNTGWNGENNGHQVKEGKYFWKIDGEFYSGQKVLFNGKNTGVITILR